MVSREQVSIIKRILLITAIIGLIVISSASKATADAPSCTGVTGITPIECEALLALYNNTDGANWVDNTNWFQTMTPCDTTGAGWNGSPAQPGM